MADLLKGLNTESIKEPVPLEHETTNVEADEQAYEQLPESKETFLEQAEAEPTPAPTTAVDTQAPRPVAQPKIAKDDVVIHVEKIMEEGLGELYAMLPEDAKPVFRKKGEDVAIEVSTMVRSLKFEVAKVLRLIREWLLTIPKVNRFFLEQEAKIKTDKLVDFVQARREELKNQP